MNLTAQDKKWLLSLAKSSIAIFLKTGKKMTVNENTIPAITKEKAAVFVTLEVKNELHGCIGNLQPIRPLYEAVIENAVSAAFDDPRFPEMTENDLKDLAIEISVLSNFKEIKGATNEEKVNKIKPLENGVILENNGNKAVFLPQVWKELPNKEEFLTHLSLKAGSPQNAWQNDETDFTTFQVQSLQEK